MFNIKIANNNLEERKYILNIIFREFLGLEYKLEVNSKNEKSNWEIELSNGNKLIIEDHFFNNFPNDLEYLKIQNIPSKIEFGHNEFIPECDLPIIYGNSKIETKNYKSKIIICGADIFASSFFMLTRWEEYVNKTKDVHKRFPSSESLALKNNFLCRPVVNEYLVMLKNMLYSLDINLELKKYNYELVLTHDIDSIYKWDTIIKFIRHLAGDLILRKSFKQFLISIKHYIQFKFNMRKDPFDTFDYLMKLSENIGIQSYFFFMGKGLTKFDNMYKTNSKAVLDIITNIKNRGHKIGIHPTYDAYNNFYQLKKEKNELENNFNTSITFGREHFLRFEVPTTWQIWDDNNFEWDSTCSYADKEGFRCGVCYEYSVFNILTRKQLNLKELPLIVMEGSIAVQDGMTNEKMFNLITILMKKVKKYNGKFVLLWHNSSFNIKEWERYKDIYERVLAYED